MSLSKHELVEAWSLPPFDRLRVTGGVGLRHAELVEA
jgi:hypothetical protein